MATSTAIVGVNNQNAKTDPGKYARIVKFLLQRNMTGYKRMEDSKMDVPVRTASNPSPMKKTAANRHPGQPSTRADIYGAMNEELAMAQFVMQDLGDHLFGHIVSTKLAKAIFQRFVDDKVIQIFEGPTPARNNSNLLDPESEDAWSALQQAFEVADRYECSRTNVECNRGESQQSFANTRRKEKQQAKRYSFRWYEFPGEPLREDKVVGFLNDITDLAFALAKPELANPKLRHRFATPQDKYHAVPLSYELDGEDMRPDFLLLPIEAFSNDFKTVDPKYVNFTTSHLVGESKNKDLAAGVEQMQRYARGLKRAQPWVYYVLGLTTTRDKAVLMRGDGSGTERLDLVLTSGRGSIEFIRILLGLALADKVDLGHNPAVVVEGKEQVCKAHNVTRHWKPNFKRPPVTTQVVSLPGPLPQGKPAATSAAFLYSESASLLNVPSSSTKRIHSEIGGDIDEGTQSKKCKTDEGDVEDVKRVVSHPVVVYNRKCSGILFTASSIRGRGTTVFCAVDSDKTKWALKMSWQDVARVAEQDSVLDHLNDHGLHPNLIVPSKVDISGQMCTTLGGIRGFLQEEMEKLGVENRLLTLSTSELKRPVRYFWGVHDFVRGLRGALLGHEYLTKIGVLHRDISENNIVLGRRLDDERGYLIDLDLAILRKAEEPTQPEPVKPRAIFSMLTSEKESPILPELTEFEMNKPMKALRTGTYLYLSYNILKGRKHTHFDDVESFLYVLLLFFFSYAGSLSVAELREADNAGFVQSIGSGRPPHIRNWPQRYADWADGDHVNVADQKFAIVASDEGAMRIVESPEFLCCLKNNWPEKLHTPIKVLIEGSFTMFYNSTLCVKGRRTEVSHTEFVSVLDTWLQLYAALEDGFSNCPFKQPAGEAYERQLREIARMK